LDIIDAWVAGKKRLPVLIPPSMPLFEPDAVLEAGVGSGSVSATNTGGEVFSVTLAAADQKIGQESWTEEPNSLDLIFRSAPDKTDARE
jgi:tRNA A58 N-methylase Trm61